MHTSTLPLKLGETLRLLRNKKKLTQENMEEMLKISASAYARIERGETDITLSRLEELANAFGMTVSRLLSFAENPDTIFNVESSPMSQFGNGNIQYNNLSIEEMQTAFSELSKRLDFLAGKKR
jgi:transcriptional regulator with XRE-family HTH domain